MHSPTDRKGKITRACVDASYDELREAIKNAPPPTRRMRERAAQACSADVCRVPAGDPSRWSPLPFLGGAFVLLVVVLLLSLGGCVPVEAIEHAKEQHAIMAGHANDPHGELSMRARQIAADAMRALSKQHRMLAGEELEHDPLPPELEASAPALEDDGPR